jgi:class 3 adenylate cyclase
MSVVVGVASGPALIGAMGSAQTRRFTGIGVPLVRAAKLSNFVPAGEVVIDEATHRTAGARLRVERVEVGPPERRAVAYRVLGARE